MRLRGVEPKLQFTRAFCGRMRRNDLLVSEVPERGIPTTKMGFVEAEPPSLSSPSPAASRLRIMSSAKLSCALADHIFRPRVFSSSLARL